jgi:hypothetical protein
MILPLVKLQQGETGSHAAHRLLSALENAAPGPFCGWAVGTARGHRLPCLAQLHDVATMEAIRRARARGGRVHHLHSVTSNQALLIGRDNPHGNT